MLRDPVFLFVRKYPSTSIETLIRVSEEINRITKAGIGYEGIIQKAIDDDKAGKYLSTLCVNLQKKACNL